MQVEIADTKEIQTKRKKHRRCISLKELRIYQRIDL